MPYATPALTALYFRTLAKQPKRREDLKRNALEWKRKNIEHVRAMDRWRRGLERGKQLPWAHLEETRDIYELAVLATKLMGKPYEVDHIVPMRSPLVCGLHVPWNLRIIDRTENRRRQNKSWPDMPDPERPAPRKSRAKSGT